MNDDLKLDQSSSMLNPDTVSNLKKLVSIWDARNVRLFLDAMLGDRVTYSETNTENYFKLEVSYLANKFTITKDELSPFTVYLDGEKKDTHPTNLMGLVQTVLCAVFIAACKTKGDECDGLESFKG